MTDLILTKLACKLFSLFVIGIEHVHVCRGFCGVLQLRALSVSTRFPWIGIVAWFMCVLARFCMDIQTG